MPARTGTNVGTHGSSVVAYTRGVRAAGQVLAASSFRYAP